jgi:DNA (cytosine-5)-methyltransferase 1
MQIYHNEIDDRCCEVLERHFPDSVVDRRSIEDVKAEELANYPQCHFFAGIGGFSEAFRRAGVGPDRNVWTGGFPCQDLSVAGKRAGLAGGRSSLYYQFQRLIAQARPDIVVVENVPGLLSSNHGKDFALVIGGLTGVVPAVPADGWGSAGFFHGRVYSVAYRIFDAQYFGVAQRRRRVFIVGSLVARERSVGGQDVQDSTGISGLAAQILFEREGLPGDTPPRRETEEETSFTLRANASHSGDKGDGGINTTLVAGSLSASGGGTRHSGGQGAEWDMYVANPLAGHQTGGDGRLGIGDKPTALQANQRTAVAFGGGNTSGPIDVATARNVKGDTRLDFDTETFVTDELDMDIRRLTPTECARLQGFSDDWNDWLSDSVRYRQFGNAVAIPNVEWIARRIKRILS